MIGKGKVKTNAPRLAEEIVDDMAKAVFMAMRMRELLEPLFLINYINLE